MLDRKSLTTNLISIALVGVSFITPHFSAELRAVGFFALSGAITNWLAIYMLFEKIPFLYGSGVIALQFETFKVGIQKLIMEQFFTPPQLEQVLRDHLAGPDSPRLFEALQAEIDYDKVFESFTDAIIQSQLGSFVKLCGGSSALNFLKAPMIERLQKHLALLCDKQIPELILRPHTIEQLIVQLEIIIKRRLSELSAEQVKSIVQEMIAAHLGWLVVWGGILGGVIGLVMELVRLA